MTEAPPPPPPPPPPGSGSSHQTPSNLGAPGLSDIGAWMTETTRSIVVRFGELFAMFVVVTIPATAIAAPLLWRATRDLVLVTNDDGFLEEVTGANSSVIALLTVVVLVSLVSLVIVFAAATSHLDVVRRGETQPWHRSLRVGLGRSPRLLGLGFIFFAIFVVANVVGGLLALAGLGPLAPIVVVVMIVAVWVRGALAPTHGALAAPGSSLSLSFTVTRGIWWPLLGRLILLSTLIVTMQLVGSIASSPLQWAAGAAAPTDGQNRAVADLLGNNIGAFLGTQLVSGLVSALCVAVWASATLSLYRQLEPEAAEGVE